MQRTIGLLETTGLTPALVALDAMEKAAEVRVVQAELNDFLGICLKITGSLQSVNIALEAGHAVAQRMGGEPISRCLARPDPEADRAIHSQAEYNPLIQQDVVFFPNYESLKPTSRSRDATMTERANFALGFIETQGFTAAFDAVDHACKAANVEVIGKEKLGGGYVTIIIKGDVAAVKAAVEAGREQVAALGTLIAAHVIPRPSESVLALLPSN